MLLSFTLSMPSSGSWNGKWSGENNLYARVQSFVGKKKLELAQKILDKGSFRYDFGDGWAACVYVEQVPTSKANTIRRKSQGFCGYDWMISSILRNLEIKVEK